MVEVIAGDDEDNGRGAKSHLLLGSVACTTRPRHDDGSDGAVHLSERALFEASLQPGDSRAEQLQQTTAELEEEQAEGKLG